MIRSTWRYIRDEKGVLYNLYIALAAKSHTCHLCGTTIAKRTLYGDGRNVKICGDCIEKAMKRAATEGADGGN